MTEGDSFCHDAVFYDSDERFVALTAPFLRGALADGHGAVAATTKAHIELLRDELGDDADRVVFVDNADWYTRPARTVAGWQRQLDEFAARGVRYTRVVGEVVFGEPDEHATWTRYESALNRVFAHAPAWIVCPYSTRQLPPTVLGDALRTHPTVWDGQHRASGAYLDPAALLDEIADPVPPTSGEPTLTVPVTGDLAALRDRVRAVAEATRVLPARQVDDLALTVTELATNCLRHGTVPARVALWFVDDRVVGEVSDAGRASIDPLAGYLPPSPGADGGMGLWLARHACDALSISSGDGGTVVRFSIGGGRGAR
ncbi:MAG TPA: sensor histidine kinase [Micromonosporaceae bacterium]